MDITWAAFTDELLRWTYALLLTDVVTLARIGALIAGNIAFALGVRRLLRLAAGDLRTRRSPLPRRRVGRSPSAADPWVGRGELYPPL